MGRRRPERSRNGCLTCRIRRVKCDETRPHCRRCTETGRKCEGPIVHQLRFIRDQVASTSQPAGPRPQLELASPHFEDERRAFHFFTHRAAPILAGAVDAGFWQDLVPRLAHTYSFVWDTVVCISSLIEHVPYTSLVINSPLQAINREHRQALRLYNRAIANVRQLAERGQLDDSIIVLSYILFSAAEFHQKNVQIGNELLKRCSKILIGSLASLNDGRNPTGDQVVHQVVTPFVMRRALDIATFEQAIRPQWVANDEVSNILRTMPPRSNAARVQFHELASQCFEVTRLADIVLNIKTEDPNKTEVLSQRQSLLDRLILWRVSWIATIGRPADVESEWIRSYLLMYWAVCYVSLAACISHRQVVFDEYMDHFAEIVEHAAVCLVPQSTKIQLLSCTEAEVIPALYFCAIKCRDPVLRREALRLIRQTPLGNLWGIVAPHRVVARFISVEEGGYKEFSSSRYAGLPPEERRFACVNVFSLRAPGGRQRQALELSRFEYASDGSRRLITGYTWLDDEEEGAVTRALS